MLRLDQISGHFGNTKPRKKFKPNLGTRVPQFFINLSKRRPKYLKLVATFGGPHF